MHYYEHHIGDYAAATSHLSFIEDAAYCRLLRIYYRDEKPLPASVQAVQRLAGARTKEEKAAVEVILDEFFTLSDEGYRNKRADEECARNDDKRRKAKASAAARWNGNVKDKSDTERNANASETHSERNANASETHDSRNAPQAPSPNTLEKQKQKLTPSAAPTALPEPPDWVPAEAWAGFTAMRRHERHPLTPRAAKLVFTELGRLRDAGHDPGAVLDQSTRNGWRDVFAIRQPTKLTAVANGGYKRDPGEL